MQTIRQKIIHSARHYAVVGVAAAGVLVLTGATNPRSPGPIYGSVPFQENEAGMLHGDCTPDGHDACAIGMNSPFGHYTKTIAWTLVGTNQLKGLVEYTFPSGAALYATIRVGPNAQGFRHVVLQFTGGTGSFTFASGTATGQIKPATSSLGADTYTGVINGVLNFPKPAEPVEPPY